ncbi:MAG: dUTP diphosphatase, partial [Actinomycetota bacterium]|nr:dUTP diphosphatase [Actinomycetota bacterium]
LVLQRVEHAVFREVDELGDTRRGTGGHGSTGGHAVLFGSTRPGNGMED